MSIVFNDGANISFFETDKKTFESDFINNYIKNSIKINDSKSWKSQGSGFAFQNDHFAQPLKTEIEINKSINGVCFANNENEIFYSLSVNELSGIYKKDLLAEKESESHVIHSNTSNYQNIDYNDKAKSLIISEKNDLYSQNLSLFNFSTNDYLSMTSGDSKDENPTWSKSDLDTVYFNSVPIGRDNHGNFIEYGASEIFKLNTKNYDISLVYGNEDFSYVYPKENDKGELFFIERPLKQKIKKTNIFLEIILIPFKLIYAIYKLLENFTIIMTGKTFTSKKDGSSVTRNSAKNSGSIFIEGNIQNAELTLEENKKLKEKFPGYAPKSFRLVKLNDNNTITEVKKGVLNFDFDDEGNIIYTNGKYIIKMKNDFEQELCKTSLSQRLSVFKTNKVVSNNIFDI